MAWRRLELTFLGLLASLLSACSGPVGLYHDVEGGAIAQNRVPPPGADLPYPNLASVPPAPVALAPGQQAAVNARIAGTAPPDVSPASASALAGLQLPSAAPPPPDVPGLVIPQVPELAVRPVAAPPPAAAKPADSVPVSISFAPGSALLVPNNAVALKGIAAARGTASVLVGGFGDAGALADDAALRLGLARAQRLAGALTADGVPGRAIILTAAAAGHGGFVQLVY